MVAIVLISDSLLRRSTFTNGRILRDRVLCGFCVRMNARKRAFKVATSVAGKQVGAPKFMLYELRKLVATVGEKIGLSDAVMRRILNHTAPKADVLHRHYVGLSEEDVAEGLVRIQEAMVGLMQSGGR